MGIWSALCSRGLAKSTRQLLIVALVGGLIYGFISAGGSEPAGSELRIIRGVSLPGLALGGHTAQSALPLVQEWVSKRAAHTLKVHSGDSSWQVDGKTLQITLPAAQLVQEALAVGHSGNLLQRWQKRGQAFTRGIMLVPADQPSPATKLWLEELQPEIYVPARNAYLDVETGEAVAETAGRRLDVVASAQAIQSGFITLASDVDLVLQSILPSVGVAAATAAQAAVRISRYTTQFDPKMKNRAANVALAAAALDGVIVRPGDVFSYNQTVGPRAKASGYREAPELLRGDLVNGIGGGVCQVSSTLYNSVMLADLGVVERYKHSAALGYVAAGRDATVSYGSMDFRFRNTLAYPVVIRTFVADGKLTISLFGSEALPYAVTLLSETKVLPKTVKEETDPLMLPGTRQVVEKGEDGKLVTITKELKQADGSIKRKIVSRNLYEAKPELVKVGPTLPAEATYPDVTAPR